MTKDETAALVVAFSRILEAKNLSRNAAAIHMENVGPVGQYKHNYISRLAGKASISESQMRAMASALGIDLPEGASAAYTHLIGLSHNEAWLSAQSEQAKERASTAPILDLEAHGLQRGDVVRAVKKILKHEAISIHELVFWMQGDTPESAEGWRKSLKFNAPITAPMINDMLTFLRIPCPEGTAPVACLLAHAAALGPDQVRQESTHNATMRAQEASDLMFAKIRPETIILNKIVMHLGVKKIDLARGMANLTGRDASYHLKQLFGHKPMRVSDADVLLDILGVDRHEGFSAQQNFLQLSHNIATLNAIKQSWGHCVTARRNAVDTQRGPC